MINVTENVLDFRECARSLWNQYYLRVGNISDLFDIVDSYKKIRRQIFRDFLAVDGRSDSMKLYAKINSSVESKDIWEEIFIEPATSAFRPLDFNIELNDKLFPVIDFFDFSERDYLEMHYILLEKVARKNDKHSARGRLLCQVVFCEFWLAEPNKSSSHSD